jgi:Sulfotransferase domain
MIQTYRLLHAKAARSKIRVPRVWSWHLGLKPQDIFQASYPRSGSTWLRFMLFEVLRGEEAGFGNIDKCIPEIDAHRGVPPILPGGGRLIKTHEQYRKDYTRAVFLVRDLRDVVLSNYARAVGVGLAPLVSNGDLDSFLLSFLKGTALQQGSWQEHTRSWLESPLAKNGNLMVVRYEDLRKSPEQVIGQLLEFLGVTPDFQVIRKAIEDNSLQQMRAKEDRAAKAGEHSPLLASHKNNGEDGRFVRKGAVGGWRSKLTEAQIKIIDQYAGDVLQNLGYEPGTEGEGRTQSTVPALSI